MSEVLVYSIVAGVFLLAGYAAYSLLLAKEKQAGLNRIVLLGLYAVVFAAPLSALYGAAPEHTAPAAAAAVAGELVLTDVAVPSAAVPSVVPAVLRAAVIVYVAGAALMALWTLCAVVRLAAVTAAGRHVRRDGYTLVLLERCDVPFSFMSYIVMGIADAEKSESMITAHELGHLRRRHWIDLLVAQAACVLMWYNPAAWLMRAELRRVHEYQADGAVLHHGFDVHDYQMLLLEKAAGVRLQSLANSLNHSNLSKRITMMYKQNNRTARRLRVLALVPALFVAAAAVHSSAMSSALDAVAVSGIHSAEPAAAAPESAEPAKKKILVGVAKGTEKSAPAQGAPAHLPEYPGGQEELLRYMAYAVRYPSEAMEAGVQGKVVVGFTIGTDGKVKDVRVITSVMPVLDEEAMRVVSEMPAWTPASDKDGNPVACSYALPVSFKLTDVGQKKAAPKPEQTLDEVVVVGYESSPKPAVFDLSSAKPAPTVLLNGRLYEGSLESLDPGAIESITVLKDDPKYPHGCVDIKLK